MDWLQLCPSAGCILRTFCSLSMLGVHLLSMEWALLAPDSRRLIFADCDLRCFSPFCIHKPNSSFSPSLFSNCISFVASSAGRGCERHFFSLLPFERQMKIYLGSKNCNSGSTKSGRNSIKCPSCRMKTRGCYEEKEGAWVRELKRRKKSFLWELTS